VVFQNNILSGVGGQGGEAAYEVDYSCRFDGANKAYLLFTPTTSSAAQKTYTLSAWVKRGNLNIRQTVIGASDSGASGFTYALMAPNDTGDNIGSYNSGTVYAVQSDNLKLRDPTAWFHTMITIDTTESVSDNRVIMYYNGERVALTQNIQPTLNGLMRMNDASYGMGVGTLGDYFAGETNFDGYIAQVAQVSELVLAPTDFGEFDDNNVWRPIDITELDYSGENSFLLDFADSSALGNDVSGNDNDFASTGLDTADQVTDTPTKNYATFSSIVPHGGTLSDGSLKLTGVSYDGARVDRPLIDYAYWEVEALGSSVEGGYRRLTGICTAAHNVDTNPGSSGSANAFRIGVDIDNDFYDLDESGGPSATYSGTWLTGDELCFAVRQNGDDVDIWIRENSDAFFEGGDPAAGTSPTFTWDDINVGDLFAFSTCYNTSDILEINFGQKGFAHTIPAGFKELNTSNIATPTILDGTANFQTTLYTGDGSVRNVDQTGNSTFQPDMVWIKNRSAADLHSIFDATRGTTKYWATDTHGIEVTNANTLTSFDVDGFGLGTGAAGWNDNTENFVAWQWLAGGGAGSSNEEGSINTTTTTANTTAGISISTFTGTGANATIGHGLGAAPEFMIDKPLTGGHNGTTYLGSLGEHYGTYLDLPNAPYNIATYWNDTAPTSSLISFGSGATNVSTVPMIIYAFAPIEGFSKFGGYTGNGNADGTYVYTGFKPAWVMIKKTSGTGAWVMYDSQRSPYNEIDDQLVADTAAAFAEYPFGGDGATPSTAF